MTAKCKITLVDDSRSPSKMPPEPEQNKNRMFRQMFRRAMSSLVKIS